MPIKKKRQKIWLNYIVDADSQNTQHVKIVKTTDNPEYKLEIDISLIKIGIFRFLEISCDKTYPSIDSMSVGFYFEQRIFSKNPLIRPCSVKSLAEILRHIIKEDVKSAINYAQFKATNHELFKSIEKVISEPPEKPFRNSNGSLDLTAYINEDKINKSIRFKKFKLSTDVMIRVRGKSFALADEIKNINPEFEESFSFKNSALTDFLSDSVMASVMGFVNDNHGNDHVKINLNPETISKFQELSDEIESSYLLKDIDNFYCLRKYFETRMNGYSRRRGPQLGFFEHNNYQLIRNMIKNKDGIYTILKAESIAKKRTLSTWPKVVGGISLLPKTEFKRHVTDPWEIRAHFAFTASFVNDFFDPGIIANNEDLMGLYAKIKDVSYYATKRQFQSAYRFYAEITQKRSKRLSLKGLVEMFDYIKDSINIVRNNILPHYNDAVFEDSAHRFLERFTRSKSLKRLVRLSQDLHYDQLRYLEQRPTNRNNKYDENFHLPWPVINPNFEKNGAKVTFLCTSQQVRDEGKNMRHCISTYVQNAFAGNLMIFHIEYNGCSATATATVPLVLDTINIDDEIEFNRLLKWEFQYSHGPQNHENEASRKGEEVIEWWVEKYNKYLEKIPKNIKITNSFPHIRIEEETSEDIEEPELIAL